MAGPGAVDQCHVTSKREKFKIKAVAIATPLPDSTNQWSPWGCEMRHGKASVLHKECGTGSWAAHTGQHTFLHAQDKGTAARGRVRKRWHRERKRGRE